MAMQIVSLAGGAVTYWDVASLTSCLIAAAALVLLIPFAIAYVVLSDATWPATGSAIASACFVSFGMIGVACAFMAQGVVV